MRLTKLWTGRPGSRARSTSRRRLPAVQRHPEQPHAALRRPGPRRQRQRLPRSRQQHQRPHPRPRGPAGLLRARRHGASPAPSSTARVTVLADRYNGKRLNSPNDVVVKSDGTVWFTDPPYGILHRLRGRQGRERDRRLPRLPPRSRAAASSSVVADDFEQPNGLAFSPDEKILYVADTGASHDPNGPRHIRAFDVADKGKLREEPRLRRPATPASSTASASTPPAASGPAPATASTATPRTAR